MSTKATSLMAVCLMVTLTTAHAGVFDNLEPVQLATGMQFTEGPVWHPNEFLAFSDINGNTIYKWSSKEGLSAWIAPSGNANGLAVSRKNEMVICRHGQRDVALLKTNGTIATLMDRYNGKRLNSPNDAVVSYMGSVFFTDPAYGVASGDRELNYEGLFCIPYNASAPILIDSTLVKPNGLTYVNDWRTLYVCESSTNTIYTYTFRDDYVIQDLAKDKKVFLKITSAGEVDGITADLFGNLYVAMGDGGIHIFNKSAVEVGQISFPAKEKVRNLCFGGPYNNQLFVTAGTSLYEVDIRFYGDFVAPGLLGMPTDHSVVFNALSDKTMEIYMAYGTSADSKTSQTAIAQCTANEPIELTIGSLNGNTRYYYQLYYRLQGTSAFSAGTSGSFVTQRAKGQSFSFAVEADPHLDEASNYVTFRNMLQNALNLQADFLIDLGDNFLTEKYPVPDSFYIAQRNLLYRNFWDNVCHSMPLFIVQGNHEGELGWLNENRYDDVFHLTTAIRKKYYPTPQPDGFYIGSNTEDAFVGKRENYYAWTWGDALFVVIDPYGYTETKSNDPWSFTLGKTQYDWLKQTLESSKARFKFVFAHQLVGGDRYGRGGVEYVDYYEMGGKNADGTYGFDTKRAGWGKPIHQLLVENGVQIYFHGHDHFYAEQQKDGVIYQEVPQPSFPAYNVANDAATYGYVSGTIIPNSGHLNVQLLGDSARVDYIGAYHIENAAKNQINGNSRRTYYIKANDLLPTLVQEATVRPSVTLWSCHNELGFRTNLTGEIAVSIYTVNGQCMGTLYQGLPAADVTYCTLPAAIGKGVFLVTFDAQGKTLTQKMIR